MLLAFVGFSDAAYLTFGHLSGAHLSCPVTGGCDQVLSSAYATIGSIPVALLGVLYYLSVFVLALYYLDTRREEALKSIGAISYVGLIASAAFVALQLFVIGALCFYCLLSAAISLTIFLLARLERHLSRQCQ